MKITASRLRQDVYRILDEVIETGVPVEIERKGKKLKIIAEGVPDKLGNLQKRPCIKGDPEDLVHLEWYGEWHG